MNEPRKACYFQKMSLIIIMVFLKGLVAKYACDVAWGGGDSLACRLPMI